MKTLADLPQTSLAQGLTHCNGCGACCRVSPCLLVPDDVRRIAEHLGESRKQFAHRVQVERTPDRRWQVRMRAPCSFLGADNRCAIHEVLPRPAREFECWVPDARRYLWSESDLRIVRFSAAQVGP